jgi:predicted nucleic acid-binding protein
VDTGPWIALRNKRDRSHERAAAHYDRLVADGARLVTTSYVADETATRLRYDLGLEEALRFRDMLRDAERTKRLRIVWIERRLAADGWTILERYADVPFSLTDATTVAVARSRRIREVFAFDDDFEAAGLTVVPGG